MARGLDGLTEHFLVPSKIVFMMQRVYLAPYGVGLGHASRLLILAENIKRPGIEMRFSSFGEARNYVESQGYECEKVPPVEFMWGKDGEFSVMSNINKIPQWLVNLPVQINKEIKYLKNFKPQIIISDSRLSPLIAARILNLPNILVINQVKLLLTPRLQEFKAVRFFETCNGELMGGMWNMSDRILIPDLPPPYTISESTINSVKSIKSKLDYVGFITPRAKITEISLSKAKEVLQIDSTKPLIFVHISGPTGTRIPIIKKLIDVFKNLPSVQFVFSEGKSNGNTIPTKISSNMWYFEWCPYKDEIYFLSDVIIMRGGHTAISQAIQYGKPIISIPIQSHGEQMSNSSKIERLGIGKAIDSKKMNQTMLIDAVNDLIYDNSYRDKMSDLMKLSNKLDGIQNVKDIVLSYV
ncbi:UDP-N-acetylglucosamine--N-acetylmuramyl-(pentapeptide) pyrophosphoryl-undecaprenol N-acetylglucosamine transferase [Candidatus Nitrosocosmicus oleophilus]|uniref:UDP-N-acetylglucosamine--N-acetylmuramyl-(Pentapeptide) pyrophosphoryl-undecaprenol N-acetylglucosamine transferase n=1 Tax=Candidatus Nitrosocosmicus oleophilus TaxID=1353260 RepID=A0A654M9R9_9ARCH|nr:glycosyltransferase family protein [Candidatus Nitrosocosmicus oleophilus]ALI36242.1 UDP-N-acetylglucosamine--N-acetylmuramyl-(pentapeptide) pyrophosphoryl-undecaprenol N-acetylglucosamine transferase [Candidatus Nitrosocosmicus oleophilus]